MSTLNRIALMLMMAFSGAACINEDQNPINPLTANAGEDAAYGVSTTLILDGSNSVNTSGEPMNYQWEVIKMPDEAEISLATPNQVVSEFVSTVPGTYDIQVTVTYQEWEDADVVTITLLENQGSQAEAKAGEDKTIEKGNPVSLDASASIVEAGTQVDYLWEIVSRPEGSLGIIQNADEIMAVFQPDLKGEYILKLTLSLGAQKSQDLIKITAIDGSSSQGPILLDADITQDQTLSNVYISETENLDYLVTKDIAVRGAKLNVEPGVRIGFEEGAGLLIAQDGSLRAYSLDNSNFGIVFQGKESVKGYWDGIQILSQNPAEYLSGIELRDAGKLGYGLKVENGANLFLSRSEIHHNLGTGVWLSESAMIQEFKENTIRDNEISPLKLPASALNSIFFTNYFQDGNIQVTDGRIFNGLDNIWPELGVDYDVLDDLEVYNGSKLFLPIGTTLNMADDKAIRVLSGGALRVFGTETAPVKIEGMSKQPGAWRGIYIENSQSNASSIFLAEIRHAGSNPIAGSESATIKLGDAANLEVERTILDQGRGHGLESVASNVKLKFNLNTIRNHQEHPVSVTADMVEFLDYMTLMENNGKNEVAVDGIRALAKDNGEIVWKGFVDKIPYTIKGQGRGLMIQSGMRMKSGVIVKMPLGSRINVQDANGRLGYLVLEGASGNPVLIRGVEETAGSWFGITYSTNHAQNYIQHAEILHAGRLEANHFSSAITVDNVPQGSLLIQKSRIALSGQHGISIAAVFQDLLKTSDLTFEEIPGENLLIWE